MFNAKGQQRASIPAGPGHSKVLSHASIKGMNSSRYANNSVMYQTQTDANRPRRDSKENPMFVPTTKGKNSSQYSTKQNVQTNPNSARG